MKRILIYFGNEQQKQPTVEQVLKDMHTNYHILQDADLNQRVANLMSPPGFDEILDAKPVHHSIDLMLSEDASDEETQKVNEYLRTRGTATQRKAMLTEHNRDWTLHDLLPKIEWEHTHFRTMDAIYALLVQSNELVIEAYTPTPWRSYEQTLHQTYECMNRECSMKKLSGAYEALSSAKKLLGPAE